jgi:hypothetical protein
VGESGFYGSGLIMIWIVICFVVVIFVRFLLFGKLKVGLLVSCRFDEVECGWLFLDC